MAPPLPAVPVEQAASSNPHHTAAAATASPGQQLKLPLKSAAKRCSTASVAPVPARTAIFKRTCTAAGKGCF